MNIRRLFRSTALVFACACFALLFSFDYAFGATAVANSVSVTSSSDGSDGTSMISVKTEIDGEVVEDHRETSDNVSLSYQSSVTSDGVMSTTAIGIKGTDTTSSTSVERMLEIINLLEQMIRMLTNVLAQSSNF